VHAGDASFRARLVRAGRRAARIPGFRFCSRVSRARAARSRADLSLSTGATVGSTMRMAAATAKPVPAKNVNGISASPVNLFSSYCCARKKPAASEHAFGSCSLADRRAPVDRARSIPPKIARSYRKRGQ